jgi:voltage-gated potassium channel
MSFDPAGSASCAMIPSVVTEDSQRELRDGRFEAYRIKADPAIAIVSAFYLVLLLIPRVAITSLESSQAIFALDIFFWLVVAADLICRIVLSTNRRDRLVRIGALLLFSTGFLALFRISDEMRDLVRLALITVVAFRAINSVRFFFRLRSMAFIASAVILIVLAFGVSMTVTEEHHAGSNINSLSDGLWWAVSTVSTVGYGDKFPVTTSGRLIAAGLMFIGVALFSILTATLANSFAAKAEAGTADQFESLHNRLDRIERNQQAEALSRRTRAPKRRRRTTPSPRIGVGQLKPEE